jgi:hypothetical protein
MSDLRPCPRCSRHVEASERACPFCDGELTGARPGKLRLVSRRELTRAAIFAGAALFAGACGSPSAPAEELDDDSAGGESQEESALAHDSDDGSGSNDAVREETEAEADARRAREEEEQRRLLLQQEEELNDRLRRRHRQCTPEGICPPYGAPPVPDALV